MSGPFKKSLVVAAVVGVLVALVDVVLGDRAIQAILGAGLIAFAIILFFAYIIMRALGSRHDEYEYEYDDD